MDGKNSRLLIVYNADSGILNALLHAVQKQIAPATYPCSLCALTYGVFSMHRRWRLFLNGLGTEVAFHHRDDFAAAYPGHGAKLPAILIVHGGEIASELVGTDELNAMEDLTDLIERVDTAFRQEKSRYRPRLIAN